MENTQEVKMPIYEAFNESLLEAKNVKEKFEVILWLWPEEEREAARQRMWPELVKAIKEHPEHYTWAEEILVEESI